MDAFWFSPISHTLALWAGCFGVAVAVYRHVESLNLVTRIIAGIAAIGIVIQANLPPMPLPETPKHGWLLPANEPSPPELCGGSKQFTLKFGDFMVTTPLTSGTYTAIAMSCSSVILDRTTQGIAVSTDLFGPDGKLVVRIRDNEFHLIEQELSYAEQSEDRSSLAVYDPHGDPLFRVKYINPSLIEIDGIFYCPEGVYRLGFDDGLLDPRNNHWGDVCISGGTKIGLLD